MTETRRWDPRDTKLTRLARVSASSRSSPCCRPPVSLFPLTMLGRHQHQTLVTLGRLAVTDLPGRTVGVRSWSQTTGV